MQVAGKDSQCNLFEFNNNSGTYYSLSYFLDLDFELIEDKTIDIDSIEKMELNGVDDVVYYVNDLVCAVKQLNKEIKEIKINL